MKTVTLCATKLRWAVVAGDVDTDYTRKFRPRTIRLVIGNRGPFHHAQKKNFPEETLESTILCL